MKMNIYFLSKLYNTDYCIKTKEHNESDLKSNRVLIFLSQKTEIADLNSNQK